MASELAAALVKVQAQLKPIARTREGQRGKYADLAAVEQAVFPLLTSAGLAWITKPMTREDGRFVLYYAMVHAATGEREEGEYPLHADGTAQQYGSDITYARRYALCAVTGAVAKGEDDDGEAASTGRPGRPRHVQRPSAPVTPTRTTGADHERHRHGTVEATPDDRPAQRTRGPIPDDENRWQDQPAGNANGHSGVIGVIQQHFKRLEVLDRDERLTITAQLAGLSPAAVITSTNDLSADESRRVLDQLAKCRNRDALKKLVTHGDKPGGTDEQL